MRFTSGARLGPFEIVSPLGSGGMGEVYRARDTRLDRTVAIKLLPSEIVNAPGRRVERFRHEARVIGRITHPNICTLHDVGEDGAAIFLVMEYVEGVTLERRLLDGPLPLALAMRTAIQIADALDHAHRRGVVHRDLKPSNVMLTRDSMKLLDFGLAKLKENEAQEVTAPTQSVPLTEVGTIVGTLPYMAPEQIEGREVDARTDIFSFGVVLYEMLSGRRPFAGDSRAALMAAIVATEPPALTSLQPQIPVSLERLIRRCLAKDPDERWQTARDLAAELRWIAEPSSETAKTEPRLRARPRRAVLWGAIAGAVITAAAFAALLPSIFPKPTAPEYRQVTYRRGAVSSARFTPDGQSFVYSASWEGRPYTAFLGRPEGADVRDLQLQDARVVSISRAGDIAVLFGSHSIARAFGTTLARVPMAGGTRRDLLTGVMDADWIPGTDALAVIRDPGQGRPWSVEFPLGTTVHETRAAWSLRVSPDGNRVAFFEGPEVFDSAPEAMITVIDKAGQKSTVSRDLSGIGLGWSPSGEEIWFTAARARQQAAGPQLLAVSLAGVERTVYSAPDWLVLHDISTDGRVLLSRNSIRMNIACQAPGEERERDLGWLVGSFANALSSDGRTLIFVDGLSGRTDAGNATLFRRGTDGSPAIAIGEARGGSRLSPDGQWVLAELQGNRVLHPAGAGSMVTLPKGEVVRFGLGAWLSDSKRIAFTGDVGDGKPRGYIQEIPAGLPRAITPVGVTLGGKAAVRNDNSILGRAGASWALFPIQGGEPQPVPALKPGDIALQWSDDGRFVYTLDNAGPPAAAAASIDVFRVEVATGARALWKTLSPSDPVGVQGMRLSVVITPDARAYCYSYMRRLGDLFVVTGLK